MCHLIKKRTQRHIQEHNKKVGLTIEKRCMHHPNIADDVYLSAYERHAPTIFSNKKIVSQHKNTKIPLNHIKNYHKNTQMP